MTDIFDPDLCNLPLREPSTRRSIDLFYECLARATRNLNRCRVLADSVPDLRETLDAARWNLGRAAQQGLVAQEQTFLACGIADLCAPEAMKAPHQAVLDALIRHSLTVSAQKGQDDVRVAVIEAARALTPLVGEEGASRRVTAQLLGKAAAHAGVDESAAAVWALETLREHEVAP